MALPLALARVVNQHDPRVTLSSTHGACGLLLVRGDKRARAARPHGHLLQHGRATGRQFTQVGRVNVPCPGHREWVTVRGGNLME